MSDPCNQWEHDGHLRMFVLDVLRTVDCLAGVVDLLNDWDCVGWRSFWPRDFTVADVVPVLRSLIKEGMVCQLFFDKRANRLAVTDDEDLEAGGDREAYYFRITNKGMKAWEAWQPPGGTGVEEGLRCSRPERTGAPE